MKAMLQLLPDEDFAPRTPVLATESQDLRGRSRLLDALRQISKQAGSR